MAKFAVIKNGVVENIVEAEESNGLQLIPLFIPDADDYFLMSEDKGNLAFIGALYRDGNVQEPSPFRSWTFNESTWKWEAPSAEPESGGPFEWNESTKAWQVVSDFIQADS